MKRQKVSFTAENYGYYWKKKESVVLERCYESDQSEFIAIYGRRRVGKTFLITHLFRDRFAFSYSGLYLDNDEGGKGLTPAEKRKIQFARFIEALRDHGFCFEEKPKDWFEAFDLRRKNDGLDPFLFEQRADSPSINAWRGLAFENLCFNCLNEIRQSLGIACIQSVVSLWLYEARQAQIDLIISRADNIVNVCEMKFAGSEFSVDEAYDLQIRNRNEMLSAYLGRKQVIRNCLITTFGLKKNKYSSSFTNTITLNDLLK